MYYTGRGTVKLDFNPVIYISGQMSGMPERNYPKFKVVETLVDAEMHMQGKTKTFLERTIRNYDNKFRIKNPATLEIDMDNPTWSDFMRNDIKHLMDCNVIVFIDGWEKSTGACMEYELGSKLGMVLLDERFKPLQIQTTTEEYKPLTPDGVRKLTEDIDGDLLDEDVPEDLFEDIGEDEDVKEPPVEESILQEAENLTNGDRQKAYGHPSVNFKNIADGWNWYLKMQYEIDINLQPQDVAMLMTLLKLAREVHLPKRDNLVDAAGYINTYNMCKEASEEEEDPFAYLNETELPDYSEGYNNIKKDYALPESAQKSPSFDPKDIVDDLNKRAPANKVQLEAYFGQFKTNNTTALSGVDESNVAWVNPWTYNGPKNTNLSG